MYICIGVWLKTLTKYHQIEFKGYRMTKYNYYCNLQDEYKESDILCKSYKKGGWCKIMKSILCPHQKPNIFNLEA